MTLTQSGENFARWRCTLPFPYVDILRYGGKLPSQPDGTFLFCCPDVDVINVFQLTVEDEGDGAASV